MWIEVQYSTRPTAAVIGHKTSSVDDFEARGETIPRAIYSVRQLLLLNHKFVEDPLVTIKSICTWFLVRNHPAEHFGKPHRP